MPHATYHLDPDDACIAWVRLSRPDARNAYSDQMLDELVAAFDAAEEDDRVRCVILTGEGPAFSAGGDLKAMQTLFVARRTRRALFFVTCTNNVKCPEIFSRLISFDDIVQSVYDRVAAAL